MTFGSAAAVFDLDGHMMDIETLFEFSGDVVNESVVDVANISLQVGG